MAGSSLTLVGTSNKPSGQAPITNVGQVRAGAQQNPTQQVYGPNGNVKTAVATFSPDTVVSTPINGGGGTQQAAYVDPFAAWGGQAQYNAAVGTIDSGLNNIRQSGTDAFGKSYNDLHQNLLNAARGFSDTQGTINNNRANNELSRMNSIQDILGYVRQGLQQGGSRLAANNATESSATGALQRAYNQIGSQKTRSVNNQAGLKTAEIDQSQQQLGTQIQRAKDDLVTTRNNTVNDIGNNVRNQLAALDQQAIGLSLPGRIAIDQEKQNIVNQGMAQLQQLDQYFNDQLGQLHQLTPEETAARAVALQQAGAASSNPFNLGLAGQQEVSGPAIDQLPLFTRSKRQAQVAQMGKSEETALGRKLRQEGLKYCSARKTIKSVSEFYPRYKGKSILVTKCKPCQKAHKKLTNPVHYQKNKEYYLGKATMQYYGITREDYLLLKNKQGDSCYICGNSGGDTPYTSLCLDHNHSTGLIRAFVCRRCNMAVSVLEDVEYLEKLFDYLEEFNNGNI